MKLSLISTSEFIKRHHLVFWVGGIFWLIFVSVFAYCFLLPQGEDGKTLGYFIGALGVAPLALILVGRRTYATIAQVENDRNKVNVDRRKMVNENFTKSIELIGQSAVTARQGGIYALQRLLDEQELYPTIVRIITSFVRERSKQFKEEKKSSDQTLPVDIEAALIVIRDRKSKDAESWENKEIKQHEQNDTRLLFDLSNSYFLNADLIGSDFRYFNLSDCLFEGCDLNRIDFTGAILSSSVFVKCVFDGSIFSETQLNGTKFLGANLENVKGLTQEQIDEAILNEYTVLPLELKNTWRPQKT